MYVRVSAICVALIASAQAFGQPTPTLRPPKQILELHKSGELFDKKSYSKVRKAAADDFTAVFSKTIKDAYGDDHAKLTAWLDASPEIREEFYTAIRPGRDNIHNCLYLFREMWKARPELVAKYPELAIAVAVVWDNSPEVVAKTGKEMKGARDGVYDYAEHQQRTGSVMPKNLAGPLDNFVYYATIDLNKLGWYGPHLPWEFLTFVVDHRTPIAEREWAKRYYVARIGNVSSWFQDIKYDYEMLRTEKANGIGACRLGGSEYTLPNILKYGGVCAMQADFVARVGKSLAQLTVYATGWGADGVAFGPRQSRHAWATWVALKRPRKDELGFTIVSDGRFDEGYVGSKYYTGAVRDPKTGQDVPDGVMELRLWAAGNTRRARRQSELCYSWLAYLSSPRAAEPLSVPAQVDYLWNCLILSSANDAAWLRLAALAGRPDLPDDTKKFLAKVGTDCVGILGGYPDLLHRVQRDFLKAEPAAAQRAVALRKASTAYKTAGRPDLICKTDYTIAGLLMEANEHQKAFDGLDRTVRAYGAEGRDVPQLLQRMEKLAPEVKKGPDVLLKLYAELIPWTVGEFGPDSGYSQQVYLQGQKYADTNGWTEWVTEMKKARGRAVAEWRKTHSTP